MKKLLHDTLAAVRAEIDLSDFKRNRVSVRLGGVLACSKVKVQAEEGPCWMEY